MSEKESDDVLSILDEALSPTAAGLGRRQRPGAKPRVLVVDDSDDYRRIVSYLLSNAGCEVVQAHDGREALQAASEAPLDLIISDLAMPKVNGYEMLTTLRSQPETSGVPTIVVTGATNRAHMRDVLDGVTAFLDKPVKNAALLEAVRGVLGDRVKIAASSAPAAPEEPQEALSVEGAEDPAEEAAAEDVSDSAADSPVILQVNRILSQAIRRGASDIHVEPFEKELQVRFRINGALTKAGSLPRSMQARLVARIKVMASLSLTERRRPQDGRIRVKIGEKKVELRVSTLPSLFGEKVVMRVLGGAQVKERLDLLGLSVRDLDCVARALASPHGLILVTGPTGSGKSTTLYTMVRSAARPDVNVVTAEDPVEAELPGITQTQVRPEIGVTFESALRAFLRQDPDIMLVGEMRDLETAHIAVKASITGHLVLSSLHTNSAAATPLRLIHMGVPGYLAAASVRLVVAQRLVRRLCPDCKETAAPTEAELRTLTAEERAKLPLVSSCRGCRSCDGKGCAGRQALFEVMPVSTDEMKKLVMEGRSPEEISAQAQQEGMTTLRHAALDLAASGTIALPEALKICFGE